MHSLSIILLVTFSYNMLSAKDCPAENDHTPNLTVSALNGLIVKNESDSWLEVQTGKDLYLICEGNLPIIWHSKDVDLYSVKTEDFISINDSFISGNYVSELMIGGISYEEIGFYSCHYKSGFNQENPKLNIYNSIYVFVQDPKEMFAKGEGFVGIPNPYIAVNNSQVKNICRPTSSFIQMSLWVWSGLATHNYTQVNVNPQTGVEFDSKYGYYIKQIKERFIKCVAKLNDREQTNIKEFHFIEGLQYDPIINDTTKTFLFVGDNFTLDCSIRSSNPIYQTLDWKFFDHCFKEQRHRLLKGDLVETSIDQIGFSSINVTVINAQTSDSGVYMCTASDAALEVRNVSKVIQVYESPKLELKSIYKKEVYLKSSQKFIFNVSISCVPNDVKALTLKWTKNGYPLTYQRNQKLSIIADRSEFTSLIINNVNCEDSGLYTIEANVLNMLNSSLSLKISLKSCDSVYNKDPNRQISDKSDLIVIITAIVLLVWL